MSDGVEEELRVNVSADFVGVLQNEPQTFTDEVGYL
jgi:hypothetical protein